MNWATASYTFTASSTSETLIFKGNGGAGCCGVLLDEVSIVANNTSGGGNSGGNNGGGSANNDEIIYWTANTMSAEGHITSQSLGNNVTTLKQFNPETGLIETIESHSSSTTVQDEAYTFDALGNLTSRTDVRQASITETFVYDNLNRLRESNSSAFGQQLFTYDALGNIQTKHGITGTFQYNGSPHGVTQVDGKSILYDANGNVTQNFNFAANTVRTLVWSSYNKPTNINQGTTNIDFRYGANRELFYQKTSVQNQNTVFRYSVNPLFEVEEETLKTTYIHYLRAGDQTIGIYKEINDLSGGFTSEETRYLHRDHLGSIVAITDETAGIVERFSFDAFGKRRRATWEEANDIILATTTKRAFTGHRNLDEVGIVHMGGRVYDPELGRFLSADPFIQEVGNQQNFNRYSYVLNNPLSYTDPSGFFFFKFFKKLFKVFGKFVKAVTNVVKAVVKNIRIIASVGIAAALTPVCGPACAGFAAGFISSGGDFKAALLGAITGQAFSYVGDINFAEHFGDLASAAKVVAHGTVGGISNKIAGGKFTAGFLSAGFTQSLSGKIGKFAHRTTRIIASAITGGIGSILGGGKFTHGVLTGTFSRLFNDEVLEHRARARLEALREFPEIQEIEDLKGRLKLTVDASKNSEYDPTTNTININPNYSTVEYETILPPGFEANLDNLSDHQFFQALDAYPKYYRLSLTRAIVHEAFHALQPPVGLHYTVNKAKYEQPNIDKTNIFMSDYFNEPFRKDHDSWRTIE